MGSRYTYKMPNRKKWLLTPAFLEDFRAELDKIYPPPENKKANYWNHYVGQESTGGFYQALSITSKKHNVTKAIYEYALDLPWYESDLFDYQLVILMIERGAIEEGDIEEYGGVELEEHILDLINTGEARWTYEIEKYDGYTVTKRDWEFVEAFETSNSPVEGAESERTK